MAKYQEPYRPAHTLHQTVEPAAWRSHQKVELTPQAAREMEALRAEGQKAHTSNQYDEEQLAQFDERRTQKSQALYQTGTVEKRPNADPKISEDFFRNTLEKDGTVYQQDQETGQFAVLSEPAKDMRDKEEIQFERQAKREDMELERQVKREDARAKFIDARSKLTTAEGAPRFGMEQIESDAERLFGDSQSVSGQFQRLGADIDGAGPPKPVLRYDPRTRRPEETPQSKAQRKQYDDAQNEAQAAKKQHRDELHRMAKAIETKDNVPFREALVIASQKKQDDQRELDRFLGIQTESLSPVPSPHHEGKAQAPRPVVDQAVEAARNGDAGAQKALDRRGIPWRQ